MLFLAFTGRAMLADEMGLGKTVQTISACKLLRETSGVSKVLIVCPTSLKSEWEEQITRDEQEINGILRPDVIILDEAQRIKNWRTKTASAVKRLRSDYAFVLTGTPIENRNE
ncbi:MAG: SNF2-related protein [Victivallales bacterium]